MAYTPLQILSQASSANTSQSLSFTGGAGKSVYLHQVAVSYGAAAVGVGAFISVQQVGGGNPIYGRFYVKDGQTIDFASPIRFAAGTNCAIGAGAGETNVISTLTAMYAIE